MTKANNWRLFSVTSIDDQGLMLVMEHINISKNVAAVLCDSSEMGHSLGTNSTPSFKVCPTIFQ